MTTPRRILTLPKAQPVPQPVPKVETPGQRAWRLGKTISMAYGHAASAAQVVGIYPA